MNKRIIKLIFAFLIIILCINTYCYAADLGLGDLEQYKPDESQNSTKVNDLASVILGTIQYIGTIAAVVMLVVIGLKYMIGSPEKRGEYKEQLKPYLIGTFLLFTGTLVPELIYNFIKNM